LRYWLDICQVSDGGRVLRIHGHTRAAETVEYSPDGQQILTSSGDATARLWDAGNGQELLDRRMVHPSDSTVYSAHFNRQADHIITACSDGRARIWDADTGKLETDFMVHGHSGLRHADFNPDGAWAVTAGEDGIAQVWDLRRRIKSGPAFLHDSWVYQACFSPDGRYVLTASFDRSARAWDIRTGLQVRRWEHNGPIHSAQFSPDGRYVVTGGWEEYTAQLWDFKTGWQIQPALRHSGNLMHAQFLPDGRRVVTASFDHTARIWDLAATNWPTRCMDGQLNDNGARYVVLSGREALVRLSDSGSAIGSAIRPHEVPLRSTLDPQGRHLFLATQSDPPPSTGDLNGRVWNVGTGLVVGEPFRFNSNLVNSVLTDKGNHLLLYGTNRMELWDTQKGKIVFSEDFPQPVYKAGLDPLSRWIYCLIKNDVVIWDIQSGRKIHRLAQTAIPNHVDFTRDGRYLAVSCGHSDRNITPCTAQVWDSESGSPVGKPLQHYDDVVWVAFNAKGDQVVTGSQDRTAQIWRTTSGERCGPLLKHLGHVLHAAFSLDSRLVVTSCAKGTARIWDVRTGDPITPPLHHPKLASARFIGNGYNVLTTDANSSQWWKLTPDNQPVSDLLLLARVLSGDQSVEYGSALPPAPDELEARWKLVSARMPAGFFTVSPEQVRLWTERMVMERSAWHDAEAGQCEQNRQWFAAIFHLERLLTLQPDNALLPPRLATARQQLASHPIFEVLHQETDLNY
jgi:WD40 repeat protein